MPPIEKPTWENFKNFAQVFCDGELGGTPLEGSNLDLNAKQLKSFLEFVLESKSNDPLDDLIKRFACACDKENQNKETIKKILQHLNSVLEINSSINLLANVANTLTKEALIEPIKKISDDILLKLNTEGEVYIPGGWNGANAHKLIYHIFFRDKKIKVDTEKEIKAGITEKTITEVVFYIYNTGDGLNYHGATVLPSGKKGYYPVYGLSFNKDKLNLFQAALIEIIKLQIPPSAYNGPTVLEANHLYCDILLGLFDFLNATRIPGHEIAKAILGQRSATCVFKAIMKMVHKIIRINEYYKQFYLAYRLFLLKQEIIPERITQYLDIVPDYPHWLDRAFANTVRMLDPDLKKHVKLWQLTAEDHSLLDSTFYKWQNQIKHTHSKPLRRVTCTPYDRQEIKIHLETKLPNHTTTSIKDTDFIKEVKTIIDSKLEEKTKPIEHSFINDLKLLTDSSNPDTEMIKHFCYRYSDSSKPLITGKDKWMSSEILRMMERLSARLRSSSPTFTEATILKFQLFSLMDRLCEASLWEFGKHKIWLAPLYANTHILPYIKRIINNPFLVSRDPMLDAISQRIYDYYAESKDPYPNMSNNKKWLSYYSQLIDAAPEYEKEVLKKRWKDIKKDPMFENTLSSIETLFEPNREYCFSYLYNENRITDESLQYNKNRNQILTTHSQSRLDEAFILQLRIEHLLNSLLSWSTQKLRYVNDYYRTHKEKKDLNYNLDVSLFVEFASNSWDEKQKKYTKYSRDITVSYTLQLGEDLVLHPAYVTNLVFNNSAVKNALTSYYDGNPYNSNQALFAANTTTFAEKSSADPPTTFNLIQPTIKTRLESLLKQLRISPATTIVSVISEFSLHPDWLTDPDIQPYLERTIFQSTTLLNTMIKFPDYLTVLDNLIKRNRRNNDDCFPEPGEWYALKITTEIAYYALEADKLGVISLPNHCKKQYQYWQDLFLKAINERLMNSRYDNEAFSLYQLKLFNLTSRVIDSTEMYAELFSCYLIISLLLQIREKIVDVTPNEIAEKLYQKAYKIIQAGIHKNNALIAELGTQVANILKKIDPANSMWKTAWKVNDEKPFFEVLQLHDDKNNHIKIHLPTREFVYNKQRICHIPAANRSSPEYIKIMGNQNPLAYQCIIFINHDSSRYNYYDASNLACYCWTNNETEFRCYSVKQKEPEAPSLFSHDYYNRDKKKPDIIYDFYLQKKINNVWHTLSLATDKIATVAKYSFGAFDEKAPECFKQPQFHVWISEENKDHFFIEDTITKQTIYQNSEQGVKRLTTPKGQFIFPDQRVDKVKYHIPPFLLRLESPAYIECILPENETELCWHLPRYGFTVIYDKSKNTYHTQDKHYLIEEPKIDTFGSGLILRALDKKHHDSFIIPLQRYYPAPNQQGQGYVGAHTVLAHDLSNHLANKISNQNSYTSGWQLDNTEKLIRFHIAEEKQDQPLTEIQIEPQYSGSADQIYLAYLYLIQDDAEQAIKTLRYCPYQSTVDELERLWWIVKHLPADTNEPITNSTVLAAQMHALHAILTIIDRYPKLLNQLSYKADVTSNTQSVHQYQLDQLGKFLSEIHIHVKDLFNSYDNAFNNIPANLILSQEMKEYILSNCYNRFDDPTKYALEAFGTRYIEIFSGTTTSDITSKYSSTSLSEIAIPILKNVKSTYSLDQYDNFTSNLSYAMCDRGVEFLTYKWEKPNNEALSVLSPWMNCQLFYKYFFEYFKIAESKFVDEKSLLRKTCRAIISIHHSKNKNDMDTVDERHRYLFAKFLLVATYRKDRTVHFYSLEYNRDLAISYTTVDADPAILKNKNETFRNQFEKIFQREDLYQIGGSCYSQETIEYKITPKNIIKNSLKSIATEEKWEIPSADNEIFENTVFHELINLLQAEENVYNDFYNHILHELTNEKIFEIKDEALEEIKESDIKAYQLKQQDDWVDNLESQLLNKRNESLEKQKAIYQKFKDSCIENINTLETIIKVQTTQAEAIKELIETTLGNRSKPFIKELGKQKETPTLAFLLHNYSQLTESDYIDMGMTSEKALELSQHLKDYLHITDRIVRLKILIKEITLNRETSVITALLSKDQAIRKQDAQFQYIENLALRPTQAKILKMITCSGKPELMTSTVIQAIMGDGKTLILMPMIMDMLADGHHLAIAVFPDTSLNTNVNNISATSNRVYKQNSFILLKDRHSDYSEKTLQKMYERILIAIKNREYMVTTVSSIQSFSLKLIEYLLGRVTRFYDLYNGEKIDLICKILAIFLDRGLVAIDEAHILLHIRKELNYAMGLAKTINSKIISTVATVFRWLYANNLANHPTFAAILKNPDIITDEKQINNLTEAYIKLLTHPDSIPDWLEDCLIEGLSYANIKNYLLGNLTEENLINTKLKSHPDAHAKLIILRLIFKKLLPVTLLKKLYEKHGRSPTPELIRYSVPYSGNNKPTPFVFSIFMETFVLTAQMVFCIGVTKADFIDTLAKWQEKALQDRFEDNHKISKYELLFNDVFKNKGGSLLSLDFADQKLIDKLYNEEFVHPDISFESLKTILGTVEIHPFVIQSNNLNFAGSFKRVYPISGTPTNHYTFHHNVVMLRQSSLLIESQIKFLLKNKKTDVVECIADSNNLELDINQFLLRVLKLHFDVKTLIDCGSTLRGLDNFDIACKIARHPDLPKQFRYILFFQEGSLHAIRVKKPDVTELVIKLTSTDSLAIQNQLEDCTPDERFTFYDQVNGTGWDILQAPHGIGVVTVDKKTNISDFLQAVMRMRELSQDQKIIIMLAPGMKALLDPNNLLGSLLALLVENQRAELEADHFEAIIKMIPNVYREDILRRIYHFKDNRDRDVLFRRGQGFFVEKQDDNVILTYSVLERLTPLIEILKNLRNTNHADWLKVIMNTNDTKLTPNDEKIAKKLKKETMDISKIGLRICKPMQSYGQLAQGNELQLEQLNEKKSELRKEMKSELFQFQNVSLDENMADSKNINLDWINKLTKHPGNCNEILLEHTSLFRCVPEIKYSWKISDNIFITKNFKETRNRWHHLINLFTKPAINVLFYLNNNNNIIALIVCQEEAEALTQLLFNRKINLSNQCWLATIANDAATRAPPLPPILQQEQQSIREQIAFVFGRVAIISTIDEFAWLDRSPDTKMQYFKEHIYPFCTVSNLELARLNNILFQLKLEHIYDWSYTAEEAKQLEVRREPLPKPLRARFKKMRPILEMLRATVLITDRIPEIHELYRAHIFASDAMLIREYAEVLLKQHNYKAVANFILTYPEVRLKEFLLICLDHINTQYLVMTQIANHLAESIPHLAWVNALFNAFKPLYIDYYTDIVALKRAASYFYDKGTISSIQFGAFITAGYPSALNSILTAYIRHEDILKCTIPGDTFCKPAQEFLSHELVDESLVIRLTSQNALDPEVLKYRIEYLEKHSLFHPKNWEKLFDENFWGAIHLLKEEKISDTPTITQVFNDTVCSETLAKINEWHIPVKHKILLELINMTEKMHIDLLANLTFLDTCNFPTDATTISSLCFQVCAKTLAIFERIDLHDIELIHEILKQPDRSALVNPNFIDHLIKTKAYRMIAEIVKHDNPTHVGLFLATHALDKKINNVYLLELIQQQDELFISTLFTRSPINDLIKHFNWEMKANIPELDLAHSPELFAILLERAPFFIFSKKLKVANRELKSMRNHIEFFVSEPKKAITDKKLVDEFLIYLDTHIEISPLESKSDESTPKWEMILIKSQETLGKISNKSTEVEEIAKFTSSVNKLVALRFRLFNELSAPSRDKLLLDTTQIAYFDNLSISDLVQIYSVLATLPPQSANKSTLNFEPLINKLADELNQRIYEKLLQSNLFITPKSIQLFNSSTPMTTEVYNALLINSRLMIQKKLVVYAALLDENLDTHILKKIQSSSAMNISQLKQLLTIDILRSLRSNYPDIAWHKIDNNIIQPLLKDIQTFKTSANKSNMLKKICDNFNENYTKVDTSLEFKQPNSAQQ